MNELDHLQELTIRSGFGTPEECMEYPGARCSTGKVDLAPIADLVSLEKLTLAALQIQDLKPLSRLTNLTELNIHKSLVSDWSLSHLFRLRGLQRLNISWATSLQDLSPLAGMQALTELSLINTSATNLRPLAQLSQLTRLEMSNGTSLYLDDPPRYDLSPLAQLTKLVELRDSSTNPLKRGTDLPLSRRDPRRPPERSPSQEARQLRRSQSGTAVDGAPPLSPVYKSHMVSSSEERIATHSRRTFWYQFV